LDSEGFETIAGKKRPQKGTFECRAAVRPQKLAGLTASLSTSTSSKEWAGLIDGAQATNTPAGNFTNYATVTNPNAISIFQ
jgi:hypothetical protein